MAQCKLTPQEFIRNSFTPQVAVICSSQAEETCKKNNLTFVQLLQPFCKLGTEAHYKDPNGTVVSIKNFKIALQDINYHPPQPTLARKYLNSSVSDVTEPRSSIINAGDYHLLVPNSTPWFEAWRDTFLQVQHPADHEFTKHFIACILVVSTADEDPVRMMVDLSQRVNELQQPAKFPKWFSSTVLRYYIILHESMDRRHVHAVECYDAIKTSYGVNYCFLLRINSREPNDTEEQLPDPWSQFISNKIQVEEESVIEVSPSSSRSFESLDFSQDSDGSSTTLAYHPLSPDGDKQSIDVPPDVDSDGPNKPINLLHGACLTMEDVEQLKLLIHEFCVRALLPNIERQILQLSDSIANKKGVSRSLFSATKRWFTPSKPGTSSFNTPSYYFDAPELQTRKLGDLYFMFGHYPLAFQAYHSAKRDFNTDQAWLFYAGALEMAGLSAFMSNETTKKTLDYMEESITTYLNTCKVAQFATRATLLSSDCLKSRFLFGDAALQLIRMTSEESDLRSALLLEQAAYCFLHTTKPVMLRKYAFHMVLAGHRFSKAAQRKHSLRCYKQAYQIYRNKGWNLAEDHIHYTIGRQANHLGLFEEAANSYSRLLNGQSRQSPQQQAAFLKEYLTIFSILAQRQSSAFLHILPIPLLDNDATKILVGPTAPLRTPGKLPAVGISIINDDNEVTTARWNKLEEMLVQEAQGSLPMIFKPLITLFSHETVSNANPTAILGEPIQVSVYLFNPLHILLNMLDIHLLWQFTDSNDKCIANEIMGPNAEQYVKTHYLKLLTLQADSFQEIVLTVTPMSVGEIAIKGLCFSLISTNSDEDQIFVKGKQNFEIICPYSMRKDNDYQPDRRLYINVVPSAPCLQVSFSEINTDLLRNELQQISVELRNVGSVPLHKVYMATSTPHLLSSCDFSQDRNFDDDIDLETQSAREREARKNHVTHLTLQNDQLEPGQHRNVSIWIKAPDVIGPTFIDLLIYYENIDATSVPKYRLVRHVWHLLIQESIKVDVSTQQSCNSESTEQLTLSVQAVNMNRIHHALVTEISILNAALLSQHWVLLNEVVAPENIKLYSQESVHILLKCERKLSKENNYSMVSFVPKNDSLQYSDSAYLDFAKRNGQNRVNIFDNLENFSLDKKKVDATLILRWQANIVDSKGCKRTVFGQNDIPVIIIKPEEEFIDDYEGPVVFYDNKQDDSNVSKQSESESLDMLQRQITYNVVHPPQIEHDFKTNKLCVIPIKLILHSIAEEDVEVIVKTLDAISSPQMTHHRPTLFHPYASKHFRWVQLGTVIRTISPLSSTTVQLSLAVLRPGTYDLGARLEVWCNKLNKPETAVLQKCRIESALIIANIS